MTEILKSDVFFFATTIVVVAVGILLFIALLYLIGILKDANILSKRIRKEGEEIINDVETIRKKTKEDGSRIVKFFLSKFKPKKK